MAGRKSSPKSDHAVVAQLLAARVAAREAGDLIAEFDTVCNLLHNDLWNGIIPSDERKELLFRHRLLESPVKAMREERRIADLAGQFASILRFNRRQIEDWTTKMNAPLKEDEDFVNRTEHLLVWGEAQFTFLARARVAQNVVGWFNKLSDRPLAEQVEKITEGLLAETIRRAEGGENSTSPLHNLFDAKVREAYARAYERMTGKESF